MAQGQNLHYLMLLTDIYRVHVCVNEYEHKEMNIWRSRRWKRKKKSQGSTWSHGQSNGNEF